MFENKKIFILGMARSGYSAAKLLCKYNNKIVVNDGNKNQDETHVKELLNLGVTVILGNHPDNIIDETFDYVIKNPGIKDTHKYILFAKKNNIKVINEMELAFHFLPKDIILIGITGTNGKTTTTKLIYEIIKKSRKNVHLTGNIGFPLSSFIEKIKSGDYIVTEISIQQLLNLNNFKTNISVLTNITEAHIDHVGSYENYQKIKNKIFEHHTINDIAIINYDNEECINITNNINSNKIYFSTKQTTTDVYLKNDIIYYKNEQIINIKNIKLVGIHNYQNIMCAIAVAKELKIKNKDICDILEKFTGVEHRLEFVCEINGRDFYNDSKSTNNKSTITALSSFTKPTILLLGGQDRKQSFEELYNYMKHVKTIICYGETKNKIKKVADNHDINCEIVNNLKEATNLAYNLSEKNDIILLSPACASWDQYKCFEDRGLEFKKIVNEIKEIEVYDQDKKYQSKRNTRF